MSLLISEMYFNFEVDGHWGSWGSWSQCSVSCGSGLHTRRRLCNSPSPSHGGADCPGDSAHTHKCHVAQCPGNVCLFMQTYVSSHMYCIAYIWHVPIVNMGRTMQIVSSGICGQRRHKSGCAFAQPDQGLRCPLRKSSDTIECIH